MRATRWPFLFIGPLIFFTAVSDIVVSAIYTNKKSTDKVRVWLGVSGVVSVPFGVVLLFLKGKTAFLWISFYNVFSVLWTVFGAISIEQALEGVRLSSKKISIVVREQA